MATNLAAHLGTERPRILRGVLAALISLALVLSFFHGCCLDGDEGSPTVAAAQASCDVSGKVGMPLRRRMATIALRMSRLSSPQDSAVAIEYVTRFASPGRHARARDGRPNLSLRATPRLIRP